MKIRTIIILGCFIGVIFLSVGYEHGRAGQKVDTTGPKIGVISVRKVLRNCRRSAKYKVEVLADQGKKNAEFEKLSKEQDRGQDCKLHEGNDVDVVAYSRSFWTDQNQ